MEQNKYRITVFKADGTITQGTVGPVFRPLDLMLYVQRQLEAGATQVHIVQADD